MEQFPKLFKNNRFWEIIVYSPDKTATIETCDATLYDRLDQNYGGFKGHDLVSCHQFDQDWSSWEIHPAGDEIVILLSGEVTFVLQLDQGHQTMQLDKSGMYLIVPRNTWHTARTRVQTKMLFITAGEGTRNKAL